MAEYVTKEQVIDWFRPYGHLDKPIPFETLVSDLRGMEAPDVDPVQEWISVKDRLPDENGRYLAVKERIAPDKLGGNRTDIVILRFFVDDGFKIPTHIPDWINKEINEEVTHWMPIPKPPEGE